MNKVDISEIVKRSLHEAKKTHGLIREEEVQQVEKSEYPPFDPEKHMPNLEIAGKAWGTGDKADESVAVLDQYIENIRNQSADFKDFLKNFNIALGMNMGSEGDPLPMEIDEQNFNLSRTVSALTLRKLMVSIIRRNKGGAAGDIWEGLYARLLGGQTTQNQQIEDIVYNPKDKALLSLKMMNEENAKIKGSKLSLAMSLARKNPGPTTIPVRYIVGTKIGKEADEMKVNFVSFDITKENYFQWIFFNPQPDTEQILKFIGEALQAVKTGKSQATVVAEPVTQKKELDFQQFLNDTKENPKKEQALQNINIALSVIEKDQALIDLVKQLTGMELTKENIYSNFLFKGYFVKGTGKSAKKELQVLMKQVLTAFSAMSISDIVQKNGQDPSDPRQQELFRKKQIQEQQLLDSLILSLNDLSAEYKRQQSLERSAGAETSIARHAKSLSDKNIKDRIEEFWQTLAATKEQESYVLVGEKASGFQINLSSAINSLDFISPDYDYQPIFIDTKALFISSQKMSAAFKKYAEPIYRDYYYMDIALRKYFIKDEPKGMVDFENQLGQAEKDIGILKNASGEGYSKASQLKENKKVFTRNYIDDILDDL